MAFFPRLRFLCAGVALLGCLHLAGAAELFPNVAPLPVHQIAQGIWGFAGASALMDAVNEGGIANLGFVVGDEAVAVIDTGGSQREGMRLLAAIRAATDKPVRYVINTHVHPDHLFGNGAFEGIGATFVGHKNLPLALATRGPYYLGSFKATMGEALLADVRLVPPTLLVDKEVILDLGQRRLVLRAWQTSHSDTDVTVLDETSGTLFSGDLVFLQHVPVIDGSILGFLAVIGDLAKIPALRVVPGHGPVVADWPQALAAQKAYLDRLAADLRGFIARGASLAQAAPAAGQSEKAKWDLFDAYNARNATTGFAELEWE